MIRKKLYTLFSLTSTVGLQCRPQLLVNIKNLDLLQAPTPEVRNSLNHFRSDKSHWLKIIEGILFSYSKVWNGQITLLILDPDEKVSWKGIASVIYVFLSFYKRVGYKSV